MQAILFDVDGVLVESGAAVAGASATLDWVRRRNIPHAFVTNTTSVSRAGLINRLALVGLDIPASQLLTPAVAAAAWLAAEELENVALFVSDVLRADFSASSLALSVQDRVSAVVVGDLGEDWNYAILNKMLRLLLQSPRPRLVALGMTRYWLHPDGPRLDLGSFVKALEFAAQTEAVVLGKPAKAYYGVALNWLGRAAGDVLMVGDDQLNDVGGAREAGMRTMLVRTGKYRESDLMRGPIADIILDSVADLPAWWDRNL